MAPGARPQVQGGGGKDCALLAVRHQTTILRANLIWRLPVPTTSLTTTPSGHVRLPARGAARSVARAAVVVATLLAAIWALFAAAHPHYVAAAGGSVSTAVDAATGGNGSGRAS